MPSIRKRLRTGATAREQGRLYFDTPTWDRNLVDGLFKQIFADALDRAIAQDNLLLDIFTREDATICFEPAHYYTSCPASLMP